MVLKPKESPSLIDTALVCEDTDLLNLLCYKLAIITTDLIVGILM